MPWIIDRAGYRRFTAELAARSQGGDSCERIDSKGAISRPISRVPKLVPFSLSPEPRNTQPRLMNLQDMSDVCVGTSVGTITEPECLGPCEPGTSVTLEGIVWHETEGGE